MDRNILEQGIKYLKERHSIDLRPQRFRVRIDNAKEALRQCLEMSMGHKVEWCDGYDEVADWLTDSKGLGLMLIGNVGRGKTEICTKALPLIFGCCLNKIPHILPAVDLCTPQGYELSRRSHLLIVDDVGTEWQYNDYGTPHVVFSELVDRMERDKTLLIANSNLTDIQIKERYGTRTIDRLRSNMRIVVLDGESLRGRYI